MSFRFGSTAAASRGYVHVASRASGDWVSGYPRTSYFLQITNVALWKSQNGTTTLRSAAGIAAVTTAKQWVRLRIAGSTICAKVWTDGTAEPAAWEITATDSAVTGAGLLQLKWIRGGSTTVANHVLVDDVSASPPA